MDFFLLKDIFTELLSLIFFLQQMAKMAVINHQLICHWN